MKSSFAQIYESWTQSRIAKQDTYNPVSDKVFSSHKVFEESKKLHMKWCDCLYLYEPYKYKLTIGADPVQIIS